MLQNLTVLFLICVFFTETLGSKSMCMYEAVGNKVVISLDNEKILPDSDLLWTHNQKRVFVKKGIQVRVQMLNIDHGGSLILENVQKKQSGEYKGQLYAKDGTLIEEKVQQLCVQEPVVKPTIIVKCEENRAILTCKAANNTEMLLVWIKNGIKMFNLVNPVLHVNSSELQHGEKFSCTVENMISKETSTDVQPMCFGAGKHATKNSENEEENSSTANTNDDVSEKTLLFGLDLWWMLVALTGGGIFFLILILICIVCVFRCRKREKVEEDYQLPYLTTDHNNQSDSQSDQDTPAQRTSKSKRPLPPIPSPQSPPYLIPSYE